MPPPRPRHFLIAGCQRAGSTWLARVLDEHPQVQMAKPLRPEPKTFLVDEPFSLDRYHEDFFGDAPERVRAFGEKSVTYVEREDIIPRVQSALPDASVLFVLRDPVERAFSNWRFSTTSGLETLSFEDALAAEDARARERHDGVSTNPFAYVQRGLYAQQLAPWLEAFSGRASVLVFEELREDLSAVRDVFDWLGVDPSFDSPASRERINASDGDATLSPEVRARLRERFAAPNAQLARLLGRPLDAWS
jgi:hypothetical protein